MTDDEIIEVLRYNKGFEHPEEWIEYARKHDFHKVDAVQLTECPDCGCTSSSPFGQYIYFSQLVHVRECTNCGLIYSDVHIDESIISQYFEAAYKDDKYFANSRKPVFDQILQLVSSRFNDKSSIIDIGGATGVLASRIKAALPGKVIYVCDVSSAACDNVQARFDIHAINCSVSRLADENLEFDLVLLVDVLYYAKDITHAWESIGKVTSADAALVLRMPNRLLWMRPLRLLRQITGKKFSDRMRGFNREHYYIFSRRYLKNRLRMLGFTRIQFISSKLSVPQRKWLRPLAKFAYLFSRLLAALSRGLLIISPSMILVAERK